MIHAPTQQDRAAWHATRVGRFTASRFGELLAEPRSKADREAGRFGLTAYGYIIAKAIERITGMPMDDGDDKGSSARRGLLLEPAALHLLNERWRPVDPTTWQPYGDDLGSTPDALVDRGRGTMDLKCPANPADVVRFGMEVQDGDFESLADWNRNYAWQIMVQALTCGCDEAHLVYFTDRLPVRKLTNEDREILQRITDHRAEQYSQESAWPWSYTYASQGYFYVARSFTLTEEIRERILTTLDRAVKERDRLMVDVAKVIAPTVEEVAKTVPRCNVSEIIGEGMKADAVIKVGDRVKVQGSNTRHCCYGMVGVVSCIVPEEQRPEGYYASTARVVFSKDEFGQARDYHWCDHGSLVHTDEPCTVKEDPLDRIRGLFS